LGEAFQACQSLFSAITIQKNTHFLQKAIGGGLEFAVASISLPLTEPQRNLVPIMLKRIS
tara:strand:+ start:7389 stop:7568 length:180 start_codon:yes stop_codon:yes gene_type:complete